MAWSAELHQRIAEAIEQSGDSSPEGIERQLADLAFHFYQAESWEKALLYCQRAGERAQELFTPSASVQHLSQAIEASRRLGGIASAKLFRLRAAAYELLGQFENALADHEAALTAARSSGDREEEWEILLGLGMLWSAQDYATAAEHYRAGLDLTRTLGDQRLIARSLNRVGNYYVNIEEPEEGVTHHEEALQIFESLSDLEGIAETLDLLGMTWLLGGDLMKSRSYYERAAQLFEEQGNRQGFISSLATMSILSGVYHTDTLPPSATFREARDWLDKTHGMAAEISWRAAESYTLWNEGVSLGPQGEFDRALRSTWEAIAIAEEIEHRAWMSAALFVLGAIQLDLQDLARSRAPLEQALDIAKECGSLLWTRTATGFLAQCYVQQGELTLASETLDGVLEPGAPAQTIGQRIVHTARAGLKIAQGQPTDALQILDKLDAVEPAQGVIVLRLAKLRAEALAMTEDYAGAERLYVSAISQVRERGAFGLLWPIQAGLSTLYDRLGERKKSRQAHQDAMRVVDYLAERIADARMRDSFRTTALARLPSLRAPSARQAAKQSSGGLTEREREVAGLIAGGKSNAAISQTLVISERTVESHVTNILAKLGFASRSQIATWAVERSIS